MSAPIVTLDVGRVRGVSTGYGVERFLGLPYAEAPLDDLRFAPAVPWTRTWSGIRNATAFGAPCHQTTGYWDIDPSEHPNASAPPPSEDCLFLNIFRPSVSVRPPDSSSSLLPVMVWLHGGGMCGGAGSSAWHHGDALARSGEIILVTLNYRLGPLGFLCHPDLKAQFGANGGANGLADQITALHWIQRHIKSFGGDASRVTLMGESSGGVSVCVLNAAPRARGLFRRAIVQSGPCIVESEGWGPGSVAAGYALSASLAASLNATSLAALRRLPPQSLQWDPATLNSDDFSGYFLDDSESETQGDTQGGSHGGTQGGTTRNGVTPRPPREAYASGRTHAEALIVGHTSFDGTAAFYSAAPLANATVQEWHDRMRTRFRAVATSVQRQYSLQRYAAKPYPAVPASFIAADSDERVACPSRELAQLASRHMPGRVFTYVFEHMSTACDASFPLRVLPWWKPRSILTGSGWASHGAEVRYIFNTVSRFPDTMTPSMAPKLALRTSRVPCVIGPVRCLLLNPLSPSLSLLLSFSPSLLLSFSFSLSLSLSHTSHIIPFSLSLSLFLLVCASDRPTVQTTSYPCWNQGTSWPGRTARSPVTPRNVWLMR